ncbi:MAG: hypothetical protein FD143_2344 [Ignavibacteria bacterium]|nr:MAG: hypothetical protein FD143_2344 [Ignavibacteria bacterium]KAF0159684.1 MAG: hypothetical protein FD188_2113 [Ignavibacteria bacterium]
MQKRITNNFHKSYFLLFHFFIMFLIMYSTNISAQNILLGVDVLERDNFSILAGKRVGLITNHTGVNSKLVSTHDLFKQAKNFKLTSVYAPEHGVKGMISAGIKFDHYKDSSSGITYFSIYGNTTKPTKEMLNEVDILVYDIQDIGVRSYTYISSMGLCMEAAAENNIPFVVLDRPNPLGGYRIEGNVVEEGFESLVSQFQIPYVYGLTCGELANLINEKPGIGNKAKCKLHVVKMEGWKRWMKFSDTGLAWVPTSPNVPHQVTPAYLIASGVLGELLIFGIGISYTIPFETFAAEWIDADSLAINMNALKLPGVIFRPISYKPYYGTWEDKILNGVQIHLIKPDKANLLEVQFYFMQVHNKMYPTKNPFEITSHARIKMFDKVMGTNKIREKFTERFLVSDIKKYLDKDLKKFKKLAKRYYLYN